MQHLITNWQRQDLNYNREDAKRDFIRETYTCSDQNWKEKREKKRKKKKEKS